MLTESGRVYYYVTDIYIYIYITFSHICWCSILRQSTLFPKIIQLYKAPVTLRLATACDHFAITLDPRTNSHHRAPCD